MWAECSCGHGPHRATHAWIDNRYRACQVCVVCGRKSREHSPFGHQFQRCSCAEYQEAS